MDSISKIDSITEEYGVDQAATGSAQPEPVVSVRGLLKRYGSHEAQEFGDHPDVAAERMRWARQLAA
jgi:hypothetical protein